MRKSPKMEKNSNQVLVLSIAAIDDDNVELSNIFARSQWPLCPESHWQLETSPSLRAALPVLHKKQVPIVLCEHDLAGPSWRELLEQIALLPDPPCVIVTSRLADEYLWAEALNLGAYDVLAKPFDSSEVCRVLSSAWLSRQHRPAKLLSVAVA